MKDNGDRVKISLTNRSKLLLSFRKGKSKRIWNTDMGLKRGKGISEFGKRVWLVLSCTRNTQG